MTSVCTYEANLNNSSAHLERQWSIEIAFHTTRRDICLLAEPFIQWVEIPVDFAMRWALRVCKEASLKIRCVLLNSSWENKLEFDKLRSRIFTPNLSDFNRCHSVTLQHTAINKIFPTDENKMCRISGYIFEVIDDCWVSSRVQYMQVLHVSCVMFSLGYQNCKWELCILIMVNDVLQDESVAYMFIEFTLSYI